MSWEVGSVRHYASFMVLRPWEAAFHPWRHTLSQALCWTIRMKVKCRDCFLKQNVRKLNLLACWLFELFWKISPDRMCENQGKARIKNPWIKNPQTKRWWECLRTKEPVGLPCLNIRSRWQKACQRLVDKTNSRKTELPTTNSRDFPWCDKVRVILTSEKAAFPLWSGIRQGCLLSAV